MKSLDIFDTIIGRLYYTPESIFDAVAKKINSPSFKWWRKHAENLANEKTFDGIYKEYATLTNCSIEEAEAIKNIEFQTEKDLTFKIVENADRIDSETILISDSYFSKSQLEELLEHNGISGYKDIIVSYDGKSSGRVWKEVKPELHIGDNIMSDYTNARNNGINSIHFDATLTDNEKWLESHGYPKTAYLCRAVRLSNPYKASPERYDLWKEQTEVNLPILILLSRYLKGIYSFKFKKFRFTTRDCCNLLPMFKVLYPDLDAQEFISSRFILNNPSKDFKEYVKDIDVENSLVVDLQGTGKSYNNFFGNVNNYFTLIYSDLDNKLPARYLFHRSAGFSDKIEKLNYFEETVYTDVYKKSSGIWVGINNGVNLKYRDLIKAQRLAIAKGIEFISNGFDIEDRLDVDLIADFLRYLESNCEVCKHINHEEI
jgi:FMN phosphatase YigB (HAD superfamily)